MTFEQTVFAVIVATIGVIATAAVNAVASRKLGMPGIAAQVDEQQEKLITTLKANNANLVENNNELRAQNTTLKASNGRLVEDNRSLRFKLSEAYDDIATLYRGQRMAVPPHVIANRDELAATPEAEA